MWIRKKSIREVYQTTGNVKTGGQVLTVIVEQYASGTTDVTVKDENGQQVFGGAYSSHKGAMVAVGRKYGVCKFKHMTETFEKSKRPLRGLAHDRA